MKTFAVAKRASRNLTALVRERRQALVQEEVLNAAATLFARRGYRAVSMDEIAARVGFGKSSIYYYYQSKENILWKIFEFSLDRYITKAREAIAIEEPPEQTLSSLIRQHMLFLATHRDWSIVFTRDVSELSPERQKKVLQREWEYTSIFHSVFSRGVDLGIFNNKIPVDIAINGILGMCNWMTTWHDATRHDSATVIADHFSALLSLGYSESST